MAKPVRKNWSWMTTKTEDKAKQNFLPAAAVAAVVVVVLIVTVNLFQVPARMTIDRAPTPAAVPTDAAPTAAPALAATSQPRATDVPFVPVDNSAQNAPIPAPAPQQDAVDEGRPPEGDPAMLAAPAEVPATPLVLLPPTDVPPLIFADSACASWHPPLVKPGGCP